MSATPTTNRGVRLTARLTYIDATTGNPTGLPSKTISFYYRPTGATTWTSIGTATTDSNGYASVTTTVTAPATYDFRAEFAGDADWEPSYAEVLSFKVKGTTSISLTVTPQ